MAACASTEGRQQPALQQTDATAEFAGHCDWVNDAVVLGSSGVLATCSSDRAIHLWEAQDPGATNVSLAGLHLHSSQLRLGS